MDEPLSLTLLYSANIAGDLALLPRLYTFLRQLQPLERQHTLLLDLGRSCRADVPHCRETGGRSTLIVLDGMGYHAANIAGALDRENRDKLAEIVTMGLVDETDDWLYCVPPLRDPRIRVTLRPRDDGARLQIILDPAASTRVDGTALYLQAIGAGQVGEAVVDLRGAPCLLRACAHPMPPDTPPNPSIAGAVEFVEAEARYFARQAR
ncbi:MAG: hypothetical protein OXG68_04210 [Chloroflexi bacterium]|nr:hypothetical protein [Chloroflexota bacterium]